MLGARIEGTAFAMWQSMRAVTVLIVLTRVVIAQPSLTRAEHATHEQCKRARRARLDAAERMEDQVARLRAIDAIPACVPPTDAPPPAWRYDVRVGAHSMGMVNGEPELDTPDSPSGTGLFVDFEAGPRPRWNEFGASLTLVAAYAQFRWRDPDPRSFFQGLHFKFIDAAVRGSVHLGPVRLGVGLGAEVGFTESESGLLPLFEAVASIDVPTGTRAGLSVLAVAQCALCIPAGWASARLGAGVTF